MTVCLATQWCILASILIFFVVQEAFSWRTEQGPSEEEIDMTPFSHPLLDTIDEKLREIEVIYNSVRSSNN